MDTKTMMNSMGGSIKETKYKGGPGAPEEILRKGLAVDLPVFKSPAARDAACVCRTLGSSLSQVRRQEACDTGLS